MLEVVLPSHVIRAPLLWTLDFVFSNTIGIDYRLTIADVNEVRICHAGRELVMPAGFEARLRQESPPDPEKVQFWPVKTGLLQLNLPFADLPVLFGEPGFTQESPERLRLHIDVLRTVFFMLSRSEELSGARADRHGRFPGHASLAYQCGFLHRPVVDETLALLWALMLRLWPDLQPRPMAGTTWVSCDVDEPYERWIRSPTWLGKGLAGALLRRKSLSAALRRVRNTLASRRGDFRHDPNWTFDWYMDQCERAGLRATFYFIARQGVREMDAAYDLHEPRMLALLRRIAERGHDIGLHGSYGSFRSPEVLRADRQALEQACEIAGLARAIKDNRQHFLQWTIEDTVPCLEQAGLKTDSSGGYSDAAGFRFGTSRAFRMWNWREQRASSVVQRPLIAMETTVFPHPEQGIPNRLVEHILALRAAAVRHGGCFGILWHNSNLQSTAERQAFVRCIS